MRRMILVALAAVMMIPGAFAATAAEEGLGCAVPADLVRRDQDLPHLRAALAAGRSLAVVVIGSGSSLGRGLADPSQSWGGRLAAELAAALPGSRPAVTNLAAPGTTAPVALAGAIGRAVLRQPHLVVWEVGNTDAIKAVPLADFTEAVTEGLRRLSQAGADVVLFNMQYSPQTAELVNFDPYRAALDQIARTENVDVFDRWAIMHHYIETGRFDPAADQRARQAAFVHSCLARLLAGMIADSVRN